MTTGSIILVLVVAGFMTGTICLLVGIGGNTYDEEDERRYDGGKEDGR